MPRAPVVIAIIAACAGLYALPALVSGNAIITIATQCLVWIVFALSYNVVIGQVGLLSFGHAIFFGAGAYAASHLANMALDGDLSWLHLPFIPILSFVIAGSVALVLGSFLAARVGVAFVMITLALSQLVIYLVINFDSIFGGEGGIAIDRAYGEFLGFSFGPQKEAYWLVLTWSIISTVALYTLTRTAFGYLAVATRENEERVRFTGQNTYVIRLTALVIAGAFAGLAGALHVINVEQVSSAQFSLKTSAFALFMCVIGGTRHFYGPIIGAIILSVLDKVLPDLTSAWMLYLGVVFCAVVIFSKRGIAGLIEQAVQRYRAADAGFGRLIVADLSVLAGFGLVTAGGVMAVEMLNAIGGGATFYASSELSLMGFPVDPRAPVSWMIAVVLGALGLALLKISRRQGERPELVVATEAHA